MTEEMIVFVADDIALPHSAAPRPAGAAAGADDVQRLVQHLLSVFPDIEFDDARLEDSGGDHRLLVLDERCAIRFPRKGMHGLDLEIAVLAGLQRCATIPTPVYTLIDPNGTFAGYDFIVGVELTPALFATLASGTQRRLLDQAAGFLSALHYVQPDIWPGDWPRTPAPCDFAMRAFDGTVDRIARDYPELSDKVAAFYRRYRGEAQVASVVLHGDLVSEHVLLAQDHRHLAGIIDFGDVALGDPAQDLMGFWVYGEAAVEYLIQAYAGGRDPWLLRRSRDAFLRYRIDRFADALADRGVSAVRRDAAHLDNLLSRTTAEFSLGNSVPRSGLMQPAAPIITHNRRAS